MLFISDFMSDKDTILWELYDININNTNRLNYFINYIKDEKIED